MTTVAQFIEYLKTLPQDTNVNVVEVYDGQWCQETKNVDLDLDGYSDNCNLYGDQLYLGKS